MRRREKWVRLVVKEGYLGNHQQESNDRSLAVVLADHRALGSELRESNFLC